MATKYISGRVKELKIGITSYSENRNSLTVIGNAGIGTVSPTDPVNSSNTSLLSAGIVTAYKFFGDGSNLSGVGNTANITADSLTVTGISTLGTVRIESGIITSTSGIVTYIGDGSRLTGVGNTANITADSLTVAGITTLGITSATDLEAQQLKVSGVSTFSSAIDANGSLDVDGHTELDEVNIAGVATFSNNIDANGNLDVDGHTELDNLRVSGVSTYVGLVDINGGIDVSGVSTFTGSYVYFGSGVDLGNHYMDAIVFNGTIKSDLEPWSSDVYDLGGGVNNFKWRHLSLTGNAGIGSLNVTGITTLSGPVGLGSNLNVVGISTFGTGINIPDSSLSTPRRLNLGDEQDLKLYHLAGHSYVYNSTGDLLITNQSTGGDIRLFTNTDINLEPNGSDDGVKIIGGGAVELYHNDILRFNTSGIGVSVAGIGSTAYIEGPENIVIDPHPVGGGATSGSVHIKGDLYVDGTEFIVDVDRIELGDFQIGIATTAGTNILLDGAGIGIGSESIRKYITWSNASSSLKSSENWNLASGKHYEIDGTDVLTSNTLGSGIVNSSLTSVGTLGELVVSGASTFIGNIDANGSLDVTGISTLRGDLSVAGVSTFTGNIDANGDVDVSGNLKVAGISTLTVLGVTSITTGWITLNGNLTGDNATNITGIYNLETYTGTFSNDINANGNIVGDNSTNISGINSVTATEFYGNGSGLTGIDVSRWASNATGIHTLTNVGIGTTTVTGAASTTNTTVLNAGIVTANYFYGSGIGLTGTDWAQVNTNLFAGNCAGCSLQSPASFGNIFIGEEAGRLTTTGDHNISVGYRAGLANCTGSNNVLLGQRSGYYNNGSYNLFFGIRSGFWNSTGNCNIMAGVEAGYYNSTGINNIYLGKNSGRLGSVGSYNLFLGFCAGFSGGGSNNCHNIILGSCAGVAHTNGSYNIFLGERSSSCSTTGSNNIAIGSTVQLPVSGGNNQLAIGQGSNYWINGDSNFNVGIGTTIPTSKFNVQGTSNLNGGVGIADSIFHLDNTDTAIRFPSDNVITFETSGNEKLRVVAGNVGIGTQVPTDQVQSSNTSILAVGILTAYKLYSSVYGEFQGNSVVADSIVGSALSIAGISTLGSVQISSGIVTSTSTSGVVTYYGDGSNLTGIGSDQFTNITVGFLTVTNTAEFAGIATVTGDTLYTKQLNVAGVSTFNQLATFSNDINIPTNKRIGLGDTTSATIEYNEFGVMNRLNKHGASEFTWKLEDEDGTMHMEVRSGTTNSYVKLKQNNNIKFETKDYGVEITGTTDTDQLIVSGVSTFTGFTYLDDILVYSAMNPLQVRSNAGYNAINIQDGDSTSGTTRGRIIPESYGLTIKTDSSNDHIVLQSPSAGLVGIGSTQPKAKLDVNGSFNVSGIATIGDKLLVGTTDKGYNNYADVLTLGGLDNSGMTIRSATDGSGSIYFADGTTGNSQFAGSIEYRHSDDTLRLYAGISERVSISTSGVTVYGNTETQTLNVTGITTLGITSATDLEAQQLNVSSSGIVTFGHIRINHALNTIDTKFANLYLDSLGGTVEVNDNLEVSGNINANGNIVGDNSTNITGIYDLEVGNDLDVGGNIVGTNSNISGINSVTASGTVQAGDFNSTSDIRLKDNIQVIEDPLAKIVQIEGVSFNWKENNKPALGVIADQVQEILPELVTDGDPKTVNYNGLIGLLIEAVKEQQIQIDELKSKLP